MSYRSSYGAAPTAAAAPTARAPALRYGRSVRLPAKAADEDIGKTDFTFFDLIGSVVGGAKNIAGLFGGFAAPLWENPLAEAIGEAGGALIEAVGTPGRVTQAEAAEPRLGRAVSGDTYTPPAPGVAAISDFGGLAAGNPLASIIGSLQEGQAQTPPQEYVDRVLSGEDINVVADQMTREGYGYSNEPGTNLLLSIVLDPLNLVGPGVGAAARGLAGAGAAVKAAEAGALGGRALIGEVGVSRAILGKSYNVMSHGLSRAQQVTMEKVLGPSTSGVMRSLGPGVVGRGRKLFPEKSDMLEDGFAYANAQYPHEVIARTMGHEANAALRTTGWTDIPKALAARRVIAADRLEREVEHLRDSVKLVFGTAQERTAWYATKAARFLGMDEAEVLRRAGGKVSSGDVEYLRDAIYGSAGRDLGDVQRVVAQGGPEVKAARFGRPAEDFTLVNTERTLTEQGADDLLDGLDSLTPADAKLAIDNAVNRFDLLRDQFANTAYGADEVADFVRAMRERGALPTTLRTATTGAHPLPKIVSDWRARYNELGYDIGFAPKDPWKYIDKADGTRTYISPFVHFVSDKAPATMRNPVGRAIDGLMRGVTQQKLIDTAHRRGAEYAGRMGLSQAKANAYMRAVMNEAYDAHFSPRGLGLHANKFDNIFKKVLGEEEAQRLIDKGFDPAFMILHAWEGDLLQVGLTTKATGLAKSKYARVSMGGREVVPAISEGVYQLVRFQGSWWFQTQEAIESPFWNVLRGVNPWRSLDDPQVKAVAEVIERMGDQADLKWITEANAALNIAGGKAARTILWRDNPIGKAMSWAPDVRGLKDANRLRQTAGAVGEEFEGIMRQVSPKLWREMTEAYGTTDPAEVFVRYFDDRAIAAGADGIGGAMAQVDNAKPLLANADEETIWQAFRESYYRAMLQSYKTHYFNPARGFLERSINHPYLGLYPASYMWGKVVPEFARFLLTRPFGLRAPLVGLAATQKVQQALTTRIASDPELAKNIEDNGELLYMFNLLLPGLPGDIPVNAPAWMRHVSADIQEGREVTPETIGREFTDTTGYLVRPYTEYPGQIIGGVPKLVGTVWDELTQAAREMERTPRPGGLRP